jgi:phosphoenolpyruvate carboxykinase (GTP)
MRVLKWIVDRCHPGRRVGAEEGVLGWMPLVEDFDLRGLKKFGPIEFNKVQAVDENDLRKELLMHEELLMRLHSTLPKELIFTRELLVTRL